MVWVYGLAATGCFSIRPLNVLFLLLSTPVPFLLALSPSFPFTSLLFYFFTFLLLYFFTSLLLYFFNSLLLYFFAWLSRFGPRFGSGGAGGSDLSHAALADPAAALEGKGLTRSPSDRCPC